MDDSSLASGERLQKLRILSGSVLKTVALVSMIIDHIGYFFLYQTDFGMNPLFRVGSITVSVYWICRKIGRFAFPIYVFLLSEGYLHSKNRFRYASSLLLFALISEIPWNLLHSGKVLLLSSQNVFFTLFLGLLAILFSERYREHRHPKDLIIVFLVFAVSYFLKADYGIRGVGFILIVYLLRERKAEQALAGSAIYVSNAPAYFLSFLLINMYNGKRGYIRSRLLKYLFYAIYPVHLLAMWLIRKSI